MKPTNREKTSLLIRLGSSWKASCGVASPLLAHEHRTLRWHPRNRSIICSVHGENRSQNDRDNILSCCQVECETVRCNLTLPVVHNLVRSTKLRQGYFRLRHKQSSRLFAYPSVRSIKQLDRCLAHRCDEAERSRVVARSKGIPREVKDRRRLRQPTSLNGGSTRQKP